MTLEGELYRSVVQCFQTRVIIADIQSEINAVAELILSEERGESPHCVMHWGTVYARNGQFAFKASTQRMGSTLKLYGEKFYSYEKQQFGLEYTRYNRILQFNVAAAANEHRQVKGSITDVANKVYDCGASMGLEWFTQNVKLPKLSIQHAFSRELEVQIEYFKSVFTEG